jgi:hypothetical protein
VISTGMQQIGNKKVIHRRTREIICNTFDYMRITFPFEALTKIGFLRICFFNLPGDQEGLFKLAVQLRNFYNSVIYNTATGYVLLVYFTNI